ncbi:MAG: hypothetical protein IKK24_00235, partial [Clostridia bacterium]|nr:hypothetical protein [Clostridia bacterium]
MKLKKIKLIHISFKGIFSLLSAFSLFFVAAMPISAEKLLDRYGSFYNTVTDIVEKLPDYRDVLAEAKENGYSAAKSAIIIDLNKYTAKGENHSLQSENGKYILKTADNTSVSFPFVVKESGLYELEVTYRLKDALSVAKRGILIDGKAFFNEAESAFFYPTFKLLDKKEYDEQGNQLLMQTETDSRWQTVRLRDSGGRIALPLSFALDSGSHTLTLNFVEEDMEIAYIAFVPPTEIKSYKAVSKEYNKNHSPKESVFIEAEDPKNIVFTNSSTLIPYSDTDPKMT